MIRYWLSGVVMEVSDGVAIAGGITVYLPMAVAVSLGDVFMWGRLVGAL